MSDPDASEVVFGDWTDWTREHSPLKERVGRIAVVVSALVVLAVLTVGVWGGGLYAVGATVTAVALAVLVTVDVQ